MLILCGILYLIIGCLIAYISYLKEQERIRQRIEFMQLQEKQKRISTQNLLDLPRIEFTDSNSLIGIAIATQKPSLLISTKIDNSKELPLLDIPLMPANKLEQDQARSQWLLLMGGAALLLLLEEDRKRSRRRYKL